MSIKESSPRGPLKKADILRLIPNIDNHKRALVATLGWAKSSLEEIGIGLLPSDIVREAAVNPSEPPTPLECLEVVRQHYPQWDLSNERDFRVLRDALIIISAVSIVWKNKELPRQVGYESKKTYVWRESGL